MMGCHCTVDSRRSSHNLLKEGCRHQVDKKVVTKVGCHHNVDKRSSHSRPMGLLSPSQQEGDVVTKSTRGRHTVDQWGCRHQVSKKGMSSPRRSSHSRPMGLPSPSQQEGDVVTKSTRGRHTVDQRSGDTKSTQERGHQVNPRRKGGETKSTHGKGRGHQVNPRRTGGDTKATERGRLGGKRRAHNLVNTVHQSLTVIPRLSIHWPGLHSFQF